jgi:DNA repair protein RadC
MKQIPKSERPREKALMHGIESLSNRELLALLIRSGTAKHSAFDIADDLLRNGLGAFSRLSFSDLCEIEGISRVKALEILAWNQLSHRISYEKMQHKDVVSDPEALIQWCKMKLGASQQEHFLVVFLDSHNAVQGYKVLFTGTLNSSLVHPREVFREALNVSCSKILVVHNHPSGNLEPSAADLMVTESLVNSGKMMKIPVIDHLIVSGNDYFSFYEHGLME